ncbi:hypothetical protein [Clostridium tagluense]|uniref:Uncharacterized protein n=1 Tax=Clostridium tagluense TaxID=360422 RepID=A0A401ULJ6_9CLOT|nr:hypothetical protein [Clostridium tagluense]GCD10404.1 hypothetical protein Ctaglu_20270 [Clostridium tagluense]
MKEATKNKNDYLIRLCDQTGKRMKTLYGSLSKEQFEDINKILESTEEDWH